MSEVSTIGLDIAKNVFHAHGSDAGGRQLFSRRITRAKVLEFLRVSPGAWWRWRPAVVRTTGLVS